MRQPLRDDEQAPAVDGAARSLVDEVDAPVAGATVMLTSGRRYDLQAGPAADQLVVRARSGEVVLRVEVTDAGPVLSFSGACLDLVATQRLHLGAAEVSIASARDVSIAAGGSLRETIGGDHHTTVRGDERMEAANVEVQASTGAVAVRAMKHVALDGEHIGLNDDPAPQPFAWSAISGEDGSGS